MADKQKETALANQLGLNVQQLQKMLADPANKALKEAMQKLSTYKDELKGTRGRQGSAATQLASLMPAGGKAVGPYRGYVANTPGALARGFMSGQSMMDQMQSRDREDELYGEQREGMGEMLEGVGRLGGPDPSAFGGDPYAFGDDPGSFGGGQELTKTPGEAKIGFPGAMGSPRAAGAEGMPPQIPPPQPPQASTVTQTNQSAPTPSPRANALRGGMPDADAGRMPPPFGSTTSDPMAPQGPMGGPGGPPMPQGGPAGLPAMRGPTPGRMSPRPPGGPATPPRMGPGGRPLPQTGGTMSPEWLSQMWNRYQGQMGPGGTGR